MIYSPEAFARSFIGNMSLKQGVVLEPAVQDIIEMTTEFQNSPKQLDEQYLLYATQFPEKLSCSILSILNRIHVRTKAQEPQNGGARRRSMPATRPPRARTARKLL
jgi:hypothetical protein